MRDQITDLALRRNTLGKGGMAVATDVFLEPGDLETFEQDRQTYGRRLQELAGQEAAHPSRLRMWYKTAWPTTSPTACMASIAWG